MFYEGPSHIISAFSFSGWRLRVQVTSSSHCPSYEGRPGATLFDGYISLRNSRANPVAWVQSSIHSGLLSLHGGGSPFGTRKMFCFCHAVSTEMSLLSQLTLLFLVLTLSILTPRGECSSSLLVSVLHQPSCAYSRGGIYANS